MGNKYQDIRFKWLEERGFNVLADDYQYHYAKDLFLTPYELQGVFCDSPAGTGKSQPVSESILTPNGWKPMGEIKVGDTVFTKDGSKTKVKGVYPQGELETYKINFSDGSSTRCSEDHLWLTQNVHERQRSKKWTVRTLGELKDNLTAGGKTNFNIPICNVVNFDSQSVLIDPYLLGALIGDGHFTNHHVGISSPEEELIEILKEKIPTDSIVVYRENYDYLFIKDVCGNSRTMLIDLLDYYGLGNKRSYEKFIPQEYLYNDEHTRMEMLRGLMDTDGTLHYTQGNNASYTTTSEKLKDDFVFLVRSLGGFAKVALKHKKFRDKDGNKKDGRPSYDISIKFPDNRNPFKIKRKADAYVGNVKYPATRFITSVEYDGKENCQCISVEDESKLYLTKDFIVTHNTTIATLTGAYGVEKETYSKIVYIRGTDIIGGELGFLPGELEEKIAPFMQPFVEALDYIKPGTYEVWKEEGKAVATTSTYMRGITIDNAFVILDETQNMTLGQLQAIYTRQTKNCKIVTIGSLRQIDNENMKLIAGKTPFEIYMLHYQSKSASYHSLKKNWRGDWSKHADNIQKTVKDLLGIQYDQSEFEDETEE